MEKLRLNKEKVLLIVKYSFSIFITLLAFSTNKDWKYLLVSFIELAAIITTSNYLFLYSSKISHIVHAFFLLVYNIQTAVMYFGGSFVSLIMVTNITLFKDLQGNFGSYLKIAIPLVACTLIPLKEMGLKKEQIRIPFISLIAAEVITISLMGVVYSPVFNVFDLYNEWKQYQDINRQVENLDSSAKDFYNPNILQYKDKPDTLSDQPNIILIFIEGISRHLLEDERNLMTNFAEFESESLHFENYYNHTFATLRGIIGQLYSGYQLNNLDTNMLFSMQSILEENGYQTTFINTEPTNKEFIGHLSSFNFGTLINKEEMVEDGQVYIYDQDAFDLLYETAIEQNSTGTPFFTAMYTFGTHMSMDSPDEIYGDGSNEMLNKFYNTDIQFGEFVRKFKESELVDNKILVVTTDHATYVDEEYLNSFPDYPRQYAALDFIPLCIYHKNIKPDVIDAQGRNSLDLVPTLFDYLDISTGNCFLGESLFSEQESANGYDRIFYYPSCVAMTQRDSLSHLTQEQYKQFMDMLIRYSAAKGDSFEQEINSDYVDVQIAEDCSEMELTLKSEKTYQNIWFPVWSEEYGQDDLVWYRAEQNEDGEWCCTVDLVKHNSKGLYAIHVYSGSEKPEEKLFAAGVSVPDCPPFYIDTELRENEGELEITLTRAEGYMDVVFPVWSKDQDQDDLIWYKAVQDETGDWIYTINLNDHCSTVPDKIIIHVYGKKDGEDTRKFLSAKTVNISEKFKHEYIEYDVAEDCSVATVILKTENSYEKVWFPVWSRDGKGEDLIWYEGFRNETGDWGCVIDLVRHNQKGIYDVHVYSGTDKPERKILTSEIVIPDYPPFYIDTQL